MSPSPQLPHEAPLNTHGSLPGRPHPFDCILEFLPECLRIFMVFMAVWYVRVHGRPLSVDLGLYMSCMWLNRAGLARAQAQHTRSLQYFGMQQEEVLDSVTVLFQQGRQREPFIFF